jgi:hypothetical protein
MSRAAAVGLVLLLVGSRAGGDEPRPITASADRVGMEEEVPFREARRSHPVRGALVGAGVWLAVMGYTVAEGGWDESGVVSVPSALLLGATTGIGALVGAQVHTTDHTSPRHDRRMALAVRLRF